MFAPFVTFMINASVAACNMQDCGVRGKKYPTPASTPTFLKFPTLTPQHEGNEIWMLKSIEIVVHSKKSVTTKVSKEIAPFQQKFQI